MQVKFEYEHIHKSVSLTDFRAELRSLCSFIIHENYLGPIMERDYHLYKDKALVALVHRWASLTHDIDKLDNEGLQDGLLYRGMVNEQDMLAWVIADML